MVVCDKCIGVVSRITIVYVQLMKMEIKILFLNSTSFLNGLALMLLGVDFKWVDKFITWVFDIYWRLICLVGCTLCLLTGKSNLLCKIYIGFSPLPILMFLILWEVLKCCLG